MDNAFIATDLNWDHRTPRRVQVLLNKVLNRLGLDAMITPRQPNMANVEARMNVFHLLEQTIAFTERRKLQRSSSNVS